MATTKAKDHRNGSARTTTTTTTTLAKKERAATAPSNSQPKTSSTKPSTTQGSSSSSSSSSSTRKAPSPSRDKQVPNYLKPTICSRQDSSSAPMPTLNRRRSFDNRPPPTSSRPQKALSDHRMDPARSSSFSCKPAPKTTPRHATKPAQTLYAKSAKKGRECFVKKDGSSGGPGDDSKSSTKDNNARQIHDSHEVVKDEELAKELLVHEVDNDRNVAADDDDNHHHQTEPVKIASEDELNTEDNHEHEIIDDHDQEEIEAKPCDITIVSEELVKADDVDNSGIEETDHDKLETTRRGGGGGGEVKPGDQSEVHESVEEENHNKDASCGNTGCEINHQSEEGTENEEAKVVEVIKEGAEEVLREEKEGTEEVNSSSKKSEEEDDNDHVEELAKIVEGSAKPKSEEAAMKRTQGGKKESQVAYNDVIEETASKLLEKRKNKVKALVGAFETVIDYESAAR